MSKLKLRPGTILPTPEEDKAITKAALSDPDTMLLDGDNVKLESFKELKKRGRPVAVTTKTRITIRCSPEVIEAFKATGSGWQTRMDNALKDWLKHNSPSGL
ncbi:BrnA antitoxin family protein [Martelella alba]|uniref:BrnA antitoxin family protein n=1 Tax=Martelella alba TaxID=2590451 RepID=A0ABY2SDX9_9HYPH|nr:BrnA antitoxin family protein [Martelella alba]TKI02428.1 BrnA antitoxin family protein [Martelella alba]